ncbi:hypothetical protein [Vibrio sp. ER1A]|uniref:hypothetical protein n=1 Tax=Vibrio sp. ER1A TaxID=1517681 RepID=UPI001F2F5C95|nr:hypothetical protein [Vibrio sp. ER1A]
MVIIPSKDDVPELKINNPDTFPVFFRVTLSELNNNKVVKFREEEFQDWPVYLERNEYIIGPEEEITIPIQLLAWQIGKKQEKDRIVAIDITPESIADNYNQGQVMNILIGYRVWLILSKDGEVIGKPSVELTKEGYVLKNSSNSVAIYDIDLCQSEFKKDVACSGSEFVLSGKEKKLNISEFKNGKANITMRDPYSRYQIKASIKLP